MRAFPTVSFLVLLVSMSGCDFPGEVFWGFKVELSISDSGKLLTSGSGIRLAVEARHFLDPFEAGITLPPGVRLISGDLSLKGPLVEGKFERTGVIRADQPGAYMIRGWGNFGTDCQSGHETSAETLRVDATSSGVRVGSSPEPDALPLELKTDSERPLRVRAHVDSPVDVPAMVCFNPVYNQRALTIGSGGDWAGMLRPGDQIVQVLDVQPENDGLYVLQAWLRPHARATTQPTEDYLFFTVENGVATASSTDPRR